MTGVRSDSGGTEGDLYTKAETTPGGRATRSLTPWLWAVVVCLIILRSSLRTALVNPAVENWATIFISLTFQAFPFLVMGVLISSCVAVFVPPSWYARALPRSEYLAVPAASAAGMVLPGCECSSVPVAGRLVDRGVPAAPALAFLLAAPAINPVVLVSTAVAFPGQPEMVFARLIASFITAVVVGWIWARFARPEWIEKRLRRSAATSKTHAFTETAVGDLLQAGGFLVLGAALVATLHTVVPQSVIAGVSGRGFLAGVTLALLAVVLSICSEADAFVAAGLTQFSLTSRLVFLVVGPMVDLKLISLQVSAFGRGFARRFAPLTLVVALIAALAVGSVVL
ncbi:MAG TPA: permease [Acidimicrobiia bacterium]